VRVAKHLNLDVARFFDELFDENTVVLEGVHGLVLGNLEFQ
jgi:hypothetical protein